MMTVTGGRFRTSRIASAEHSRCEELSARRTAGNVAQALCAASSARAFAGESALWGRAAAVPVVVFSRTAEGCERRATFGFLRCSAAPEDSAREVGAQMSFALEPGGLGRNEFERPQTSGREASGRKGMLLARLRKSGVARPQRGERKTEIRTPKRGSRQAGFSVVTAVFLVVVLALLGAFIVSVSGLQQAGHQLDVQGVRAYQAARAGLEWGAYQVLDPNNTLGTPALPSCPASPTSLSGLAQSLSVFTVTVTCSASTTTEGNRNVGTYLLVATACNQPAGGACPNPTPAPGYVERQLQAIFSKCKDPTAAAPRFACG